MPEVWSNNCLNISGAGGDVVALVMTTHETPVASLKKALDEMEDLPIVKAKPVAMPILLADLEG